MHWSIDMTRFAQFSHRTRPVTASAAVVVAAGLVFGLAACAPQAVEPTADRQSGVDVTELTVDTSAAALLPKDVAEAGTLVVGVDPTYAPNEFKDPNGAPIGWEIDLIDAAAAKLGLTTDYRVAKFDNIVPSILGEKYDLGLGGYYDTKKRQETLDMIDFFAAGNQFAAPADAPITDELDACGLKVGAQNGGSAALEYLPALQDRCADAGEGAIEVLGYETQDEQTAALKLGRIEAMVSDSPVTSYAVKLSEGEFVASPVFDQVLSGAPVNKDRGEFAEAMRSAIQGLLEDGTYSEILEYWGVEAGAIDEITINASEQ